MGTYHIQLEGQTPLSKLFSEMPTPVREFIRGGFSVVASLPVSAHPHLLRAIMKSAQENRPASDQQLANSLNVSVEDATKATAAVGMFSAIASSRKETTEELLQGMIDSGIVSAPDKPALLLLVPAIKDIGPAIQTAISRTRLADAVLPSFEDFEVVLDIRLGDDEGVEVYIPVAIAFLKTDANDQRLWFQLTKSDVEGLIEELNSLLKKFKKADELATKLASSSGGV
jgi:hypothetical protein